MNPALLIHIKELTFEDVPFEFKNASHSQTGLCHQNCEEYIKANPQSKCSQVFGWIEKTCTDGRKFYVLHSCIRENGVLKDITPWEIPKLRGKFAEDKDISIDPQVNNIFSFLSAKFQKLPDQILDT